MRLSELTAPPRPTQPSNEKTEQLERELQALEPMIGDIEAQMKQARRLLASDPSEDLDTVGRRITFAESELARLHEKREPLVVKRARLRKELGNERRRLDFARSRQVQEQKRQQQEAARREQLTRMTEQHNSGGTGRFRRMFR